MIWKPPTYEDLAWKTIVVYRMAMPPGRKGKTKDKEQIVDTCLDNDDMADNGDDEQDNGVTYFVDEEGRYYYQPAGNGQGLVSLSGEDGNGGAQEDAMIAEGEGEGYQTVTLVPSASADGEVSYVLVVQEDNKMDLDIKMDGQNEDDDEDKANDVYNFDDDEENVSDEEEAPDETKPPAAKKPRRSKRALFTCNFCSYTSHRRYLLLRHLKTHSEERPHKCLVCERGFKTQASLQNHMNMHNGVKPHICKYCESPFTTSGELVRHVRYKHTHEKPHKCTECDYASVELSKLRRHIRCHTGERPYQCQHCTYASPDTFKLKRHLRTHTGEKPYKCDMCNMCFTQSNSLKAHRRIHNVTERPQYACELCPAKCGRKTDLRIHVQKLHTSDKPLKCKRCGKSFPDRYSCKVHNKTHEGEKCYKCQLCPYASTTSRHLKTHLLKHTDEKPFPCDYCDQSFRQKQLLRRHENLYHNPNYVPKPPKEKTHTCHDCSRTFARKGNLIRHLAVHDPDSGHQERALALKLGRQKKIVKFIDSEQFLQNMLPDAEKPQNTIVKLSNDLKHRELVTVSDRDGQQYVVLEVIHLEDGTEQQVAVVAPDFDPPNEDEQEEEEEEEEEDEDEDEEEEVSMVEEPELKHKKPTRDVEDQPNVKLEDEVDTCFGFEEEPEEDEEVFNEKLVFELV